eukprot:SAG11_NODE_37606_length_256_cov_0.656051_1_plen_44_part_01
MFPGTGCTSRTVGKVILSFKLFPDTIARLPQTHHCESWTVVHSI